MWLLHMLICVDQLVQCWIRGWWYVWLGGDCPSADETVSDWIGQSANAGKRWATIGQKLIDGIFGQGYCQRAIADDDHD